MFSPGGWHVGHYSRTGAERSSLLPVEIDLLSAVSSSYVLVAPQRRLQAPSIPVLGQPLDHPDEAGLVGSIHRRQAQALDDDLLHQPLVLAELRPGAVLDLHDPSVGPDRQRRLARRAQEEVPVLVKMPAEARLPCGDVPPDEGGPCDPRRGIREALVVEVIQGVDVLLGALERAWERGARTDRLPVSLELGDGRRHTFEVTR